MENSKRYYLQTSDVADIDSIKSEMEIQLQLLEEDDVELHDFAAFNLLVCCEQLLEIELDLMKEISKESAFLEIAVAAINASKLRYDASSLPFTMPVVKSFLKRYNN